MELENKIREVIGPVIAQQQLFLVDLELSGGRKGRTIKIFIDKLSGVTIDECSALSREIAVLLDVEEVMDGSYRLEVSSPGIDRPLKDEWQFMKNLGRKLKVTYENGDVVKELLGVLEEVAEGKLVLMVSDGKREAGRVEIPLIAVRSAVVQIQW